MSQPGMSGKEADKQYLPMFLTGVVLMLAMLYWHCYGLWTRLGLAVGFIDELLIPVGENGGMDEYKLKALITVVTILHTVIRSGSPTKRSWTFVLSILACGLALFYMPFIGNYQFLFTSVTGYILMNTGFALLGRKAKGAKLAVNDDEETFEQCDILMESDESINIPTRYKYRGKMHKGYINVVNPFRATMVMGLPGAGKSFAILYPFIDQMLKKGYTMFLYDYKYPDLSQLAYNKWLQYYPGKWSKTPLRNEAGDVIRDTSGKVIMKDTYTPPDNAPQFCVLNFDDPRESMRCNPLNPKYLKDTSDAHEVAEIIMKNVNPKGESREDFFTMSAKVYVAALVWQLKKYKGGIYCTFPHLIELMGKDYQKVFEILQQDNELATMIRPFASALEKKALEQLEGQIASATIPLLKFPSAMLYWALSGDDFELDINNPDAPKIICMGNNPDRQAIYGTTLALYTSRIFKVINHKRNAAGKRNLKCGVLLDELPTIFIKGLDNLIATARSNKVAIVLGAQDKTQLIRDYTREEATVILGTVGNIISGQVNGETARDLSNTFGQEFRVQESETTGGSSDTISRSSQKQELLPQSRIETLSQGQFCGRLADDVTARMDKKLFCGYVVVDSKKRAAEEAAFRKIPMVGEKYFKEARIRSQIMENPSKYCGEYIKRQIEAEYEKREVEEAGFTMPDKDTLWAETEARYRAMTDEERVKLLDKVVDANLKEHMMEVINDNYVRIQQDIDEMFASYEIDSGEEEDEGEGAEGEEYPGGVSEEFADVMATLDSAHPEDGVNDMEEY